MRVLLADDHTIMRQGLRSLLELKAMVKVIGEADNGREAVELVAKLAPEAVIMDIAMPEMNGLEATEQIHELFPKVKILILSMHKEETYVHQAFKLGAAGYILKDAVYEEIKLALDAIKKNKTYISPSVSQLVINKFLLDKSANEYRLLSEEKLSPREKEIVQLLAEGKTRHQIAQLLSISPKTVDRHRENIKLKLELDSKTTFEQFLLKLK